MKISKELKLKVKENWGDWERIHGYWDETIEDRLRELDPEYMKKLDKLFKGATFWFA